MRGVNETQGRRLPLHHRAATVAADGHPLPRLSSSSPFGHMCGRESHSHFLSPRLSSGGIARFRGARSRGANTAAATCRVRLYFLKRPHRAIDVSSLLKRRATRSHEKASLRSERDSNSRETRSRISLGANYSILSILRENPIT